MSSANSLKRAIVAEAVRRNVGRSKINYDQIRVPHFDAQNFFLDQRQHRFRALQCTRRAGKSSAEVIDHIELCLKFPKSRTVYMGLTLDSVTEICWDIFKDYNDKHRLGLKFNESKRIVKFPNGSRVRLIGVNASEAEMRKVLGQKLRKVTIDEAGSITIDMKKLCYQMIGPALTDLYPNSWLTICGTCEDIPNTFFEKVMSGQEKDEKWFLYKWDTSQNPFLAKQWKERIDQILTNNPKAKEASWFRTHYLNEWCTSDDLLIIPWKKMVFVPYNPKAYHGHIVMRLSIDLGHTDATSFTLTCHDLNSKKLHYIFSYKKAGLDFSAVASEVRMIQGTYSDISEMIIDGANKQGVEELRHRHNLPFVSAEKTDKYTYLRQLRDDVIEGNNIFNPGDPEQQGMGRGCQDLLEEWKSLIWDKKKPDQEDSRCQNHCSDGALYNHRHSKNYQVVKDSDPPPRDTEAYMDMLAEKEAEEEWKKEKEEAMDEEALFGA